MSVDCSLQTADITFYLLLFNLLFMATSQDFMDYVLDQIENAGIITYKKMFGEYALYSDGKVVALVADNKLFVKPTEKGRSFIGNVQEAPAYPGAKMSFLIEDQIDDRLFISKLIRITASELPDPKPKKPKTKPGQARTKIAHR